MALSKEQKVELYRDLVRAMAFDRMMLRIIRAGKMVGFYHEGGIALAPGVAAGFFLNRDDPMWIHYRAHGIAHMVSKRVDLKSYIAEHMGREAGCCKGRSSFHPSFPDDHIFGLSGNIGANFPASVGYGFAAKYKGKGQVVMNCSGDGSYQEGRAYEGLHMAAKMQLPIIFWCENNGMAQHSALKDIFPISEFAPVAESLGIRTITADGQNLFACGEAARTAVDHARGDNGPIFVELKVLRSQEHNVGGINYEGPRPRSAELMQQWVNERSPLVLAAQHLLAQKILTQDAIDRIAADAEKEAGELEAYCDDSPRARPSIESLMEGVFAPSPLLEGIVA